MSPILALRIVAVVTLGLAVAHAVRVLLWSIAGHARLEPRDAVGEALHGLGAFALALGLLPGDATLAGEVLIVGGVVLWLAGALVQPIRPAARRG